MPQTFVALLTVGILSACIVHAGNLTCKCVYFPFHTSFYSTKLTCYQTPSDSCWPTPATWSALNNTLSGKLIKTIPIAAPCYPGPYSNPSECTIAQENWTNTSFLAENPVGYSYPYTQSCDLPGGNTTTCGLGDSPIYAVSATTPEDVVAGVNFAREWNLRLVVKMSGHDMLGRSTGYGSLEIWMRYLRLGVSFEEVYSPTAAYGQNQRSVWNGSAIEVSGGHDWDDVHAIAAANGVIVVNAGCPVRTNSSKNSPI